MARTNTTMTVRAISPHSMAPSVLRSKRTNAVQQKHPIQRLARPEIRMRLGRRSQQKNGGRKPRGAFRPPGEPQMIFDKATGQIILVSIASLSDLRPPRLLCPNQYHH
jgi:hypothetical protein